MTTEILILAQGSQTRLPDVAEPKQWLALPACGNTPILARTLAQLWALQGCQPGDLPSTTVVTWPRLTGYLRYGLGVKVARDVVYTPHAFTLHDPGNSSLKGARRALTELSFGRYDRTVILLGDVVYSWKCLELLLSEDRPGAIRVAATSDLSPSGGELWGISWPSFENAWVMSGLDAALEKHPPFREYQCGQLRRWHWAMRDGLGCPPNYLLENVDDYTDDIDVPEDVKNLPDISAAAAMDDLTRGITWPF